MVGIVLVSHSAKLAAAVQELATQIIQGSVTIALAAGIDDPENPFGTDAMQVYQAIESVYSDDGVVVLMDLGSAVLSAEMALEFLPDEQRAKVRLCEAPLVEGAIAAVVQAAAGSDIERVLAEARGSLTSKVQQLQAVVPDVATGAPTILDKEIRLTVQNQLGLHARPAAKFVATASRFQSHITVQNLTIGSNPVNAISINSVVTLGVRQGHEIAIAAEGADALEALAALQQLVEAQFGEASEESRGARRRGGTTAGGQRGTTAGERVEPTSPLPPIPSAPPPLSGIPASPGIAIGPVVLYLPAVPEVRQQADNSQAEWQQLQTALVTARHQIQTLRQKASAQVGEDEAAIFDAQLLCLEDPVVLEAARQLIFDRQLSAAAAWQTVVEQTVQAYQSLEDAYLQARSTDVKDVGQRVLRLLIGVAPAPLDMKQPGILVATDLTPSETAQLDSTLVLGICTVSGGATSHSAILARSLGIPAVVGVGAELSRLENGTRIALNGETGQVWVNPDDVQSRELQAQRDTWLAAGQTARAAAQQPAITRDGRHVKVMANICGIADAQVAVDAGAEGVGLLRTEFLYLDRLTAPTEEEQLEVYQAIAQVVGNRPLIIRTLDIGGDKPLPYLNLEQEANPFLGWRGIRLCLDYPDLLKTQLRAILRFQSLIGIHTEQHAPTTDTIPHSVTRGVIHPIENRYNIKVMFPMIASVREVRAAKEILATAQAELRSEGIPFNEAMEVGIMVEVPAAVAIADQLAAEVDFFSIGTNDLSQYVMAADRTNPKVTTLADAFEPAVLRLIRQTIQAAHDAGIWVGVCGELASYPAATPILVGLGVDELSMNSPAIPAVKAAVSRLTMVEAEAIARAVLQLDSAEAVREYVAAQQKLHE